MSKEDRSKWIKLSDDYYVTTNKYNYILKTRKTAKGEEVKTGGHKGKSAKEDSFDTTYYPRLSNLINAISELEIRRNIEVVSELIELNKFKEKLESDIKNFSSILTEWKKG